VFVKNIIELSQRDPGMKHEVSLERRKNILKSLFSGFYHDINKPVIFNTNRAWTYLTPQIKELYPKSKIIICVRDINLILNSFETAHRENPLSINTVMGDLGGSVYSRVDSMMSETGIVGFPYIGLKQAITSNEKNMLMLIEYNDLCKNTEKIIKSIYSFIDEPYFDHDLNNVESNWEKYDLEIGMKLHNVRKTISVEEKPIILPPDILMHHSNMEVWRM
jgi:sulfotransferase